VLSVSVSLQLHGGHRAEFLDAITNNATASVREEPGCQRFDVIQDSDDPSRIHLYEVYSDAEAFAVHTTYAHYAAWREVAAACVVPGSQIVATGELLHSADARDQ
jgi:autoinducer 2-degrading protein